MDTKLYVGNLSYSVTEDELREMFAQAGAVTSVAVIKDRDTGQSKGFAFVEFGSQADAQKAISRFNGQKLGERTLTVNLARPKEERSRSGGYGGGGYSGGGGSSRGGYGGKNDRRSGGGGSRRY
jgi:RNA recognition motif-containing protein